MARQLSATDVPAEIARAIETIEDYFSNRGVLSWALGGVQSRTAAKPEVTRYVVATAYDLVRAITARDWPPKTPEEGVYAAMTQLGLVCLGDRSARIELPNGKHLIVRLEE